MASGGSRAPPFDNYIPTTYPHHPPHPNQNQSFVYQPGTWAERDQRMQYQSVEQQQVQYQPVHYQSVQYQPVQNQSVQYQPVQTQPCCSQHTMVSQPCYYSSEPEPTMQYVPLVPVQPLQNVIMGQQVQTVTAQLQLLPLPSQVDANEGSSQTTPVETKAHPYLFFNIPMLPSKDDGKPYSVIVPVPAIDDDTRGPQCYSPQIQSVPTQQPQLEFPQPLQRDSPSVHIPEPRPAHVLKTSKPKAKKPKPQKQDNIDEEPKADEGCPQEPPQQTNSSRPEDPVPSTSQDRGSRTPGNHPTMRCKFCVSNKESLAFCQTHILHDDLGRVVCPILRKHICRVCGATGDYSHTFRYCPHLPRYDDSDDDNYCNVRNAAGKMTVRKY